MVGRRLLGSAFLAFVLISHSSFAAHAQDSEETTAEEDLSVAIDPLDFCALAPKARSSEYQKQRVILFDIAESPSFKEAPEVEYRRSGDRTIEVQHDVLRGDEYFPHAREVLLTLLPMKRHYLVIAKVAAGEELAGKRSFTVDQARELVDGDRLATYSMECADWIAAPYLVRGPAEWSRGKFTRTVRSGNSVRSVEYEGWNLDVDLTLRIEVYRRKGDRFVHKGTLEADSDDFRASFNSSAREMAWNNLEDLHSHLSVDVPMTCPLPGELANRMGMAGVALQGSAAINPTDEVDGVLESADELVDEVGEAQQGVVNTARDATNAVAGKLTGGLADHVATFSGCGGLRLDFSMGVLPVMEQGQGSKPWCKVLEDDDGPGHASMEAVALCEVRKATETATLDVQLQAKRFCGWSLFAGLVHSRRGGGRAISMGEYEGAQRGDYYVAYGGGSCENDFADAEELGFARIVDLGPGGERGLRDPSQLAFRSGDAPPGARMTEYAMHGARLDVEPAVSYLLLAGDLDTTLMYGGAIKIGYDLTRFVSVFDELWTIGNTAFMVGPQQEMFLNFDASLEAVTYLGRRLGWLMGLGLGGTWATVTATENGTTASLSGISFALALRTGVEYVFRPEWSLRVMAEGRSGVTGMTLANEDAPGVEVDAGTLTGVGGSLAIAYTF